MQGFLDTLDKTKTKPCGEIQEDKCDRKRKRNYHSLEFDTQKLCQTILNISPGEGNKKILLYAFDMFPYIFISMLYIKGCVLPRS